MSTAPASAVVADKLPPSFDRARLLRTFEPSTRSDAVYAWSLEAVKSARDAQCRGDFRRSAALAEATKTDPTLYGALLNRICPHRRLSRTWSAVNKRIELEAAETFKKDGIALSGAAIADCFEGIVQLGLRVCQNIWTPREPDASRIDVRLDPWPMSTVWYDAYTGTLKTQTTKGIETITHGDGKWVVAAAHAAQPWQWGAIKACGLAWATRAFHIRDRTLNSETHGEGKFIGTPPPDMEPESDPWLAFEELMETLRKRRSGGVVPHGSEVKLLEAMGPMWQIFREAIVSEDKDIARAYLGQDGSLVNEGGNYIKAAELAGVRYDLVEGDTGVVAGAINTGMLRPWSIVNFGRDCKVETGWALPDPDAQMRAEHFAARAKAFGEIVAGWKAVGAKVDQALFDRVAADLGIAPPVFVEPVKTEPVDASEEEPIAAE